MKVVAVVPAYNEASAIGAVVNGLRQFVDVAIVVDDGSTDPTGAVAATEGAVVLRHFLNRGQGAALQTGMTAALRRGADIVVTFDADGQHRVEDVPRLIEPLWLGRYDLVLGSRFLSNSRPLMPRARRWLLQLGILFDRTRTGLAITDTHNGLRAFSRRAGELITIRQDRMAHASEILDEMVRLHFRFIEVPVHVQYTPYSRGKGQGWRDSVHILWDLVRGRITR